MWQLRVSEEVKTVETGVTCTRLMMALDPQPVAAVESTDIHQRCSS